MDQVEGCRDAGDGHAGVVEGAADGGDLGRVDVAAEGGAPDGGEVPVGEGVAGPGDRRRDLLGGRPGEGAGEDAQPRRQPCGHGATSAPVSTAVAVASMRRTAARPSRTSGTGRPPARTVRANASTWRW